MVQLELIPNALEDGVLEGSTAVLALNLDEVILAAHHTEDQIVLEPNILVVVASSIGWTHIPDDLGQVIDLLLGDSFPIANVQAVEINDRLSVVVDVDLVKDLPRDIKVNLLHHFLKLLVRDFVSAVLGLLILFLNIFLKLFADLIILLLDHQVLLMELLRGSLHVVPGARVPIG
jgi:hypothetical protein